MVQNITEEERVYLDGLWGDPHSPYAFGGVKSLHQAVLKEGKHDLNPAQIKTYFKSNRAYTLHKKTPRHFFLADELSLRVHAPF